MSLALDEAQPLMSSDFEMAPTRPRVRPHSTPIMPHNVTPSDYDTAPLPYNRVCIINELFGDDFDSGYYGDEFTQPHTVNL